MMLLLGGCTGREAEDDQQVADITRESGVAGMLLEPENAYAQLVERFGEDYEACGARPETLFAECADAAAGLASPEDLNVELVLDASGSMVAQAGGASKMDAAREAIVAFAETIPAGASVALRVYGHVGSNEEADKTQSCEGTELLQEFGPLDEAAFELAVSSFEPTGWTPIAASLDAAGRDFGRVARAGDSDNVVYLVSDGIETCDGDPVAAARRLHEQNVQAVVNVIGFDVDAEAARQLEAVAEAGGGTYLQADTRQELWRAFNETSAEAWARYNCVSAGQWGADDDTSRARWGRNNCLFRKAWAEYNAVSREVWRQYDAGEIDAETRRIVLEQARAKRKGILDPARKERKRVLKAARDRRQGAVNDAQQQRTEWVDSARYERKSGLEYPPR